MKKLFLITVIICTCMVCKAQNIEIKSLKDSSDKYLELSSFYVGYPKWNSGDTTGMSFYNKWQYYDRTITIINNKIQAKIDSADRAILKHKLETKYKMKLP